jgi:2-polyprenyl-3-methyl-5-hydroxy-6-metoxy-1,4-benzoquinol methylase
MSPVNALPSNSKGFHDVFGNAWEWTEDYFCPLPGFTVHPYYEDFSMPCFDGLHHIIQGGSFISTGNEASIHARFHFRPHFTQHATCRLVEQIDAAQQEMMTSDTDAPGPYVGSYPFRTSTAKILATRGNANVMGGEDSDHQKSSNILLSKHFGHLLFTSQPWGMNAFASQIFKHIHMKHKKSLQDANVIEVGCGVGGLTFSLANSCSSIIGIDHSMEAITLAKQILHDSSATYTLSDEGNRSTTFTVRPFPAATEDTAKERKIDFRCADPMCLPAEMHAFDVVILHDVIDKVSSPNAVLGRLSGVRGLVTPGGVLVMVSAYQWAAHRTPKSLWFSGQQEDAGGNDSNKQQQQSSEEVLIARLAADGFVAYTTIQVPLFYQPTTKDVKGKIYTVTFFTRK